MAYTDILELLELRLRNFLSYGNNYTTIDLTVPGTTLIVGEDLDSGTGSANGVGKTSLLNGIVYALYDQPLAKEIKLDKLINNINKKNMEVHLKFRKFGDEYEISRYRKGKDGNTVVLKKNGTPITRDSIDQTNKYIEQIIGYSYDLFVRIVVFSAGHMAFLDLPTSGAKKPTQGDIMEELFDLTSLSDKAERAKKEIKATEQKMDIIKAKIEQIERERDRHAQQIENTKRLIEEWGTNQSNKINRIKNDLKMLEGIDFEKEQELHKLVSEMVPAQKELRAAKQRAIDWEDMHQVKLLKIMRDLKKIQNVDFDKEIQLHDVVDRAENRRDAITAAHVKYNDYSKTRQAKIDRFSSELSKIGNIDFDRERVLHSQLVEKQSELKTLNVELEHKVKAKGDTLVQYEKLTKESQHLFDATCPYCLQHFADARSKAEKIGDVLSDMSASLKKYDADVTKTNGTIEMLAAEIVALKDQITIKTVAELTKLQSDKESYQQRLSEAESESNPYINDLKKLLGDVDDVDYSAGKECDELWAVIEDAKPQMRFDSANDAIKYKADYVSLNQRLDDLSAEINPFITPLEQILTYTFKNPDEIEDVCDKQIDKMEKSIQKLRAQMTVDNIEELLETKNNSSTREKRLEELAVEVNPYKKTLADLEAVDLDEAEYDAVNEMTKLVEHQKFLVKLLTKSDSFVRKNLIEQNIPFLNTRLRENVKDLGLAHKVEFTNTMEVEISLLGRELDVANLSRGQKARVNLALAWAFHDVLQSMHGPVNFCLLDEVLDVGLCSVGVVMAAKMLKNRARRDKMAMFIISHKQEVDSVFDRTMKIQLHRGFSRVVL